MSSATSRQVVRSRALTATLLAATLLVGCLETDYVLRAEAQGGEPGLNGQPGAGAVGGAGEASAGSTAQLPPCDAPFRAGLDFAACRAGAWGEAGEDQLLAAAIQGDGSLLLGGRIAANRIGVATLTLTSAGAGLLERTDVGGRASAQVRLGNRVNDLVVLDDSVLVATDLGVTRLTPDLSRALDDQALGEVLRLAATAESVLTLGADGRARSFDATSSEQAELPLQPGERIEDVALDRASGLRVITGAQLPPVGSACGGTLPFIRAYDAQAKLVWSAYDTEDPLTWCASSTGKRLEIKQNKLYYAGEQQGGNSVHLQDPRDPAVQAPLVSYDQFSTGAGKAIATYSFVARFDLATGTFETGQVVLPRDAATGGALSTSALAVDEAGRIYLGGQLSCCLERRGERTVAGAALGPYAGPEASLLVLSADLRERLTWTSFTGTQGPAAGDIGALAVASGIGVLGATTDASAPLLNVPPLPPTPPAPSGGYLVVFPAP